MKKRQIGILAIILILVVGICLYTFSDKTYGNDIESMSTIISSQSEVKEMAKVFDYVDINEFRIAGYITGNSGQDGIMGYAIFKADKKGDYLLQSLCHGKAQYLAGRKQFVTSETLIKDDKTPTIRYDIILSDNSDLEKVERIVNKVDITTMSITRNPSITLMKGADLENYSSTFFFYGSDGNILE